MKVKRGAALKKGGGGFSSGGGPKKRSLDLAATSSSYFQSKQKKTGGMDEHIDSSEDEDDEGLGHERKTPSIDDEAMEDEPLEAKRVRLAREYLEKLDGKSGSSSSSGESGESSEEDGDDDDKDREDPLTRKLRKVRQKEAGTYERLVADKITKRIFSSSSSVPQQQQESSVQPITYLRGHDLTPTCIALTRSGTRAVSGSKDHSVILWDLETETKLCNVVTHWKKQQSNNNKTNNNRPVNRTAGQVLSVACSDDERYAAVGKRDGMVYIFDIRAKAGNSNNSSSSGSNVVHTFKGHKGPVTCLTFRKNSLDLFSGSDDRCIRHYNLTEMMFLQALYGHQFGVTSIDCLSKGERPISVGQDRTARAWKLANESHLIFRGGSKLHPADGVTLIRDNWFLTCHQDGHLALWNTEKKKAVTMVESAHGIDTTSGAGQLGRAVTSVSCLPFSDIVASGSSDGYVRFWKVRTGQKLVDRGLDEIGNIPLQGYVNALAFGPKAGFCVAAVGQEHRLGRWNRIPGAKNRIAIIKLRGSMGNDADDSSSSSEEDEKERKPTAEKSDDSSSEDGGDANSDSD